MAADPRTDEYLEFACRLAARAGEAILPYFRVPVDIHNKAAGGAYDPVTAADRGAEEVIRNEIRRVYPTHGVHGEEHGQIAGSEAYTWIIDPIDGTRAFILGQLHWGTLIALNDGARPLIGVMHQPYVGETFAGAPGRAELRTAAGTRALRTRICPRFEDAVLCATHPDLFQRRDERAAFDMIAAKVRQVRYGGDCYMYALIAMGLVDLVIESGLHAYDIQPLMPLIESAGGVVTSWSGGPADQGGQIVAAGDPDLHGAALQILGWAASAPP